MSFTFNNISSDTKGVVVEKFPSRPIASKVRQTVTIPGRNGQLIYAGGAFYDNVTQVYECYMKGELDTEVATVMAWLQSPNGYARLTDSYDKTHFREAMFMGGGEVASAFHEFGRASLEFSCKPQRWLLSGEIETSWSSEMKIFTNPTAFAAKPLIRVHGSGNITLTVDSSKIAITGLTTSKDIFIDCDSQDFYNGTINMGNMVTLSGNFPVFKPGDNIIQRTGGSSVTVYVTPRWWEL